MEQSKKERRYKTFDNYKYIYRVLFQYDKKIVLFDILEIIFGVLVPIGGIILPALIVNVIEEHSSIAVLIKSIVIFLIVFGVINACQVYIKNRNEWQYIQFRTNSFMKKLLNKSVDMNYMKYEDEDTQVLLNNAIAAVSSNQFGVEKVLHINVMLAVNILGLIVYLCVLMGSHPIIGVILFITSFLQIGVYFIANNYEMNKSDERAKLELNMSYLERQEYDVGAGKDIRMFQLQDWLLSIYKTANQSLRKIIGKERKLYYANDCVGTILQYIRGIICYGYLLHMIDQGMSVSDFVLYLGIITGCANYFSAFTEQFSEMIRHLKKIDFVREYFDIEEAKKEEQEKLDLNFDTFCVEFDDVCFSYPNSDHLVLDHINFKIQSGQKVALVGINGAGKTTIVKLLCGFYQPVSGTIRVNGKDLSQLDSEEYFKLIAVVFQESFLLSLTIGENISCSTVYDHKKCKDALIKAGLWEVVDHLENKLDTFLNQDINENGVDLSGGEQQKLMLARALYSNAKMLILDEPTAALDAIAENKLYERYNELTKGKTTFFISHRLASTRFCDTILFLKDGKISEMGTHEELIAKNADYAYMYNVQSHYYETGDVAYE